MFPGQSERRSCPEWAPGLLPEGNTVSQCDNATALSPLPPPCCLLSLVSSGCIVICGITKSKATTLEKLQKPLQTAFSVYYNIFFFFWKKLNVSHTRVHLTKSEKVAPEPTPNLKGVLLLHLSPTRAQCRKQGVCVTLSRSCYHGYSLPVFTPITDMHSIDHQYFST